MPTQKNKTRNLMFSFVGHWWTKKNPTQRESHGRSLCQLTTQIYLMQTKLKIDSESTKCTHINFQALHIRILPGYSVPTYGNEDLVSDIRLRYIWTGTTPTVSHLSTSSDCTKVKSSDATDSGHARTLTGWYSQARQWVFTPLLQ